MNKYITLILVISMFSCQEADKSYTSWPTYNGTKESLKYSSLTQIDTNNVNGLEVAWTYHSGDVDTAAHSQIQTNPIVVDGILYGVNPAMKLFAIDAETGVEKWVFDPVHQHTFGQDKRTQHNMINSRGICYWTDGKADKRIFFTGGSYTYAVDAQTGKLITEFGKEGYIDLHERLGREVSNLFVVNTSPGIIYKDLIILGCRVDESLPSAPGHIRAYSTKTGKLQWIFHTIPHPGEEGYETWEDSTAYKFIGGVNCWSGFSMDEKRGIVYVPLGSAAYDFYGGNRKGANLFANSLVALDAATGKRIWHYQTVHHDIWDKDLPAPPSLLTLNIEGKKVDVVAQITKNGFVFVLDRTTGKPIFDISEAPVDHITDLIGEQLMPTQPMPTKPKPFARQTLTKADINPYLSDSSRAIVQKAMNSYRSNGMFTPNGLTPSLIFPGFDGGGEWGGPAVDPETGFMYVNANNMAWVMNILKVEKPTLKAENNLEAGMRLYKNNCATCHGSDRNGSGNNPSIIAANQKYKKADFLNLLNSGRRMMPAFGHLTDDEKQALSIFILDLKTEQTLHFVGGKDIDTTSYVPYRMAAYRKFLSPEGYPAISPPWGTLTAIDLNTGEHMWQNVFGEYPELTAKGIPQTGAENYGGPVVTAGGLLFIAANRDGKMRAYNKFSGKLLWEYTLPAPGYASPAAYEINGRQFIVIAAGGGKMNTKSSDVYMAFALPK